jgi:hypothetical protein
MFDPEEVRQSRADTKKEHEKLTDEIAKRDKALDRLMVDDGARAALLSHEPKGIPEMLLVHVAPSLRRVEVDGDFVVRVVDEKGTVRIKDSSGTPMTPADLVDELYAKPDFRGGFGRGRPAPSDADAPETAGFDPKTATDAQKSAFIAEHGFEKWRKAIGVKAPGDADAPDLTGFDAKTATDAEKSAFIAKRGIKAWVKAIGAA